MLECFRITEKDASKIADLEASIFQDSWTEKGIVETLRQPHAFIVAAVENDEIAGYCILYHVLDEGEIARIGVGERFRRKGFGRKILDYVVKECENLGVVRLLLDVRESNTGARNFYQNYGFVEDGTRKNFYDAPRENAILMSKIIV